MKKMTMRCGVAVLAAVSLASVWSVRGIFAEEKSSDDVIPAHIRIAGIDVSDMTATEAKEALADYVADYTDVDFTLTANDGEIVADSEALSITSNEDEVIEEALGYGSTGNLISRFVAKQNMAVGKETEFSLSFKANRLALKEYLEENESTLDVPAIDNGLVRENDSFTFVEGEEGSVVDIDASVETVADYVANEWEGGDGRVALVTKTVEPGGDKEQLSAIKDVLGTYTTNYSSSAAGRKQNIANGASKINGKIVYPGEQLSVAENLHPITEENGYAIGGAYENGQTVEVIGGGVCQISTTLYNAVIRSELQIDQRSPHSMTVSYVSPSMDAAIAGDYKDFKFTNNLDYPIYVEMLTNGASISATVYGKETRAANRTVEFESEVIEQIDPVTEYVASGEMPIGSQSVTTSPHTGYRAQLIKIVKTDGVEESREVFNTSNYRVSNRVVTVGIASDNPEASAAVNAAIATQDEATIAAAAAQWNADALAAQAAEATTELPAVTLEETQLPEAEPAADGQ